MLYPVLKQINTENYNPRVGYININFHFHRVHENYNLWKPNPSGNWSGFNLTLLTQEWSKKLLSACILPMNQTCHIIWSVYKTRQICTREKGTTFFSCSYLTSSPTTCLVTVRDTADMKQEAKKCQLEKKWKSRLHPRSKKLKGQLHKIRAETGSSTRIF